MQVNVLNIPRRFRSGYRPIRNVDTGLSCSCTLKKFSIYVIIVTILVAGTAAFIWGFPAALIVVTVVLFCYAVSVEHINDMLETGCLHYLRAICCCESPDTSAQHALEVLQEFLHRPILNHPIPGPSSAEETSLPGPLSAEETSLPGPLSAEETSLPGPLSAEETSLPGPLSAEETSLPGPLSAEETSLPGPLSAEETSLSGPSSAVESDKILRIFFQIPTGVE
ncbi:unnamed protein product [Larinioides sclopetarius]|uniref:Uncharacterized protein n=2 Tax=Larinioides sclopetarius TaxID=280406 RepID=A0AAV2B288_9ARAC